MASSEPTVLVLENYPWSKVQRKKASCYRRRDPRHLIIAYLCLQFFVLCALEIHAATSASSTIPRSMPTRTDDRVFGQFAHPLVTADAKECDPWKRDYLTPPQEIMTKPIMRTYPLYDIRPVLSQKTYDPLQLLQTHGFGVVNHETRLLSDLHAQSTPQVLQAYNAELKTLILDVLGASQVFFDIPVIRRGQKESGQDPTPQVTPRALGEARSDDQKPAARGEESQPSDPATETEDRSLETPVRLAHVDHTPLGARQIIRFSALDIFKAAKQTGVIAFEDQLCYAAGTEAHLSASSDAIASGYNKGGNLGPRYAIYSIWRPLRRVERDPLAVAPWKNSMNGISGLKSWPFHNKHKGTGGMSDYVKEFAALATLCEVPPHTSDADNEEVIKWYYISHQTPDQVLFVKLFDSAALGEDAQEAGAPWHSSPEIGTAQGDGARESIEIRVAVFW